jgi:uncharacterized membrane protein
MTLAPLLNASPAIEIHAFAAMAAFALGIVQFAAPKGTLAHRTMGWAWVALMVVVSVSAFFIHQIKLWGTWSPIHLLAGFTLVGLGVAVHAARRHVIARHQRAMMALFFGALVIAGGFTFMPGRIMNAVITSPGPDLGMPRVLIGAPSWVWLLLGLLIWLGLRNLRQRTIPAWALAILPAIALVLAPARILSAPNVAVSMVVYILAAAARPARWAIHRCRLRSRAGSGHFAGLTLLAAVRLIDLCGELCLRVRICDATGFCSGLADRARPHHHRRCIAGLWVRATMELVFALPACRGKFGGGLTDRISANH